MCKTYTCLVFLALAGCASVPDSPRQYQDEASAVTVTVVAKPWIFSTDNAGFNLKSRDALNIYAIDVNRQGEHRQFLAVLQSPAPDASQGQSTDVSALEIETADGLVKLAPTQESPQAIGIVQPLAEPFALTFRWLYFPTTAAQLEMLGKSASVRPVIVTADNRVGYVEFESGQAQLAELGAALR
jgi:hypothetical protein